MLKKTFASFACVFMLLLGSHRLWAQDKISPENMDKFHAMEDTMLLTIDSMYNAFVPDSHITYSEQFVKELARALRMPDSYYYPFDKLKDKINIMYPDDNSFRIFNWSITTSPVTNRYYGAIQLPSEQLRIYPLIDYTASLGDDAQAQDSILTGNKWFGALYYRILTREVNGDKVYTLFGLNTSNPVSTKKILDPLIITDRGAQFGAPIFNMAVDGPPEMGINRYIMEYKKGVQAGLNWDDEKQLIYFDKLVSQTNDPNRKYTYVPSGEYDGFKWEHDRWNYVKDLIPVQVLKDGEAPSGTAPEK